MKTYTPKKISKIELAEIPQTVLLLVIGGLVLAFGTQITGDVKTDNGNDACATAFQGEGAYNASSSQCYNSSNPATAETPITAGDFQASSNTVTGLSNLSLKMPSVGTIIGAVLIIGVLVGGFRGFMGR